MTTEHAADEAGGEVVYSSDGLEPLPAPIRPKLPTAVRQQQQQQQQQSKEEGEGKDVVDYYCTDSLSPRQAFEVFAGRLYPPAAVTSAAEEAGVGAAGGGGDGGTWLSRESPLERLGRLQRELAELEQEVTADGPLTVTVQELKQALTKTTVPGQAEWTARMQGAVSGLSSTAATAVTAAPSSPSSTALEERLRRVEALVGAPSAASGSSDLADRLTAMETSASRLDEAAVESFTKKAKVIRQDLEAASKARNKLAGAGVGSGGGGGQQRGAGDDSKTISRLHDALTQLSGVSRHLPAVAVRLQQLAHLHADAATWAARLADSEQEAAALLRQVASIEASVENVRKGVQEDAAKMQENMNVLDERIKRVTI